MTTAPLAPRGTGLTRAKHIERLMRWLGLPLLLALLCLTAGIVNYTPVRTSESTARKQPAPTDTRPREEAPRENPMPVRGQSVTPEADALGSGKSQSLVLDLQAPLS